MSHLKPITCCGSVPLFLLIEHLLMGKEQSHTIFVVCVHIDGLPVFMLILVLLAQLILYRFAQAKKCSNEGRALMQLDFQQFRTQVERMSKIR